MLIKHMYMDRRWICRLHHMMDMNFVDGMTMTDIPEQHIQQLERWNLATKPIMVISRILENQS